MIGTAVSREAGGGGDYNRSRMTLDAPDIDDDLARAATMPSS